MVKMRTIIAITSVIKCKGFEHTKMFECDGKYAFEYFEGKVTPYQTRNFAKEYGCTFNCCLDSGGSSQMINEGKKGCIYKAERLPMY